MLTGDQRCPVAIVLFRLLEAAGVRAVETDLGEYIIQLAREKPSHIIVPAIHKTREQIAELFAEKLKCGLAREVAEITAAGRGRPRGATPPAGGGGPGAEFAAAPTGAKLPPRHQGRKRTSPRRPAR